MIFPIRTDRRLRRRPVVNIALIVLNVVVFIYTKEQIAGLERYQYEFASRFGFIPGYEDLVAKFRVYAYYLSPERAQWYQFFSYQFLHAGWQHLFGNMIFLWVFGNSLEDRLGRFGYLAFYLTGGVLAGLGHCAVSVNPVLGASGSVAAVTGGFLALFPLSNVTIVWWMLIIHTFEVSSIYLILLYFGWDVFQQVSGMGGGVANMAHISGYVFGFGVCMALLATRILTREIYDFMSLVDRWNRRRQLRAVTRSGQTPWVADARSVRKSGSDPVEEPPPRVMELRGAVVQALKDRQEGRAVDQFAELMELDASQVLNREVQLDVANHAMGAARYELAAQAYEGYLKRYDKADDVVQIRLILALIYTRYVRQPDRAREILTGLDEKLTDPDQQEMARTMLKQVGG